MIELNRIYNEDCLEGMKRIPDGSIDMILCDLPYGTTACKWDTVIPFEPLWEQYNRIIKDNGAIVLTASQPFTSNLVMSNPKMFKYEWIWNKTRPTGSMLAKKRPLKEHECILVFYKKQPTYNPQMTKAERIVEKERIVNKGEVNGNVRLKRKFDNGGLAYPRSIQVFANPNHNSLHPTQKPVELFEYLIKTYTAEGEIVLDNCIGSGTTAIACINTNRNYIGFELDKHYCEVAKERVRKALAEKEVGE